eukprot:jgi/Psemu1/41174/gm1.41174_g
MSLELALLGYYYDNYLTPDYNSPLLGNKDRRRRDPLLNCFGVDHVAFRELLDLFEHLCNCYTYDRFRS